MAERAPPKARGRSRARSQGQPETPRRPGQPGPPEQPAATPRPGPPAVQPMAGRAPRGSTHAVQLGAVESVTGGVGAIALRSGGNGGNGSNGGNGNGDNGARGGGRAAWRGRDFTQNPVTRPLHVTDKKGVSGNACTVVANYFELKSTPSWAIYQYHVDFSPEPDNIRVRRGLLYEHRDMIGIHQFDGAILYAIRRLEQDEMDVFSINRLSEDNVKIHIKLTKELSASDPIVMNIMGIQLRKYMRIMGYKFINGLYYDEAGEKMTDSQRFRVWPGFSTAVHQYDGGTMLCADLCFKILRTDTVLDLIQRLFTQYRGEYRVMAAKELIGSIVLTRYNNLTYRIDDIDWNKKPESTFLKNGNPISFVDYHKQHWNLDVTDFKQPLLVSNPKRADIKRGRTEPSLFIPEFCIMTGISDDMRGDFNVMKDIATHTRVAPEGRARELTNFMGRMENNQEIKKDMDDWGLSFDQNLVSFSARYQNAELIVQAETVRPFKYDERAADWSKEMRAKPLLKSIDIKNYLMIATSKDMQMAKSFIDVLYQVCKPMGINIDYPQEVTLNQGNAAEYSQALKSNIGPNTQLVICILPNIRKERYDVIKKICCLERPVASQAIVARTISKPQQLMSVATKIGIQLNCKLGGAAWTVEVPIKNIMVIGYDAYHDSSQRGRTVGAVCCSIDERLTRYYSRVTFQTSRQEMVEGLKSNITAAIKHYHKVRNILPDRIIIYRDGVGESMLAAVKEFELEQIQACFRDIGSGFKPRLTFIVVSKKINTRIFAKQGRNMINPMPGTTIDTTITKPEFYDFFLVSQSVRQGTVTPTHYNVIHDDSDLKPDHIQRLTYKLTHLYYNWPGTIRVPAPCLYAHKLAFLTGQSLHNPPNEALADTLFFL